MMPVTNYTVVEGELLSENRAGTKRDYLPDPLGSTVALLDNTQSKTDTYTYWPYGEAKSHTGTSTTPFDWLGTLGYYRESSLRFYIRSRYYLQNVGRWQTEDLFNVQVIEGKLFEYALNSPFTYTDPSGLFPIFLWPPRPRRKPTPPDLVWVCCKDYGSRHCFISTLSCGAWGFYAAGGWAPCWEGEIRNNTDLLKPLPDTPPGSTSGTPGVGRPGIYCAPVTSDPKEQKRICNCIDESTTNPPIYCLLTYTCQDWVATCLGPKLSPW
jgi:RHS repeat-associated protein